jgi:hypothetical protein
MPPPPADSRPHRYRSALTVWRHSGRGRGHPLAPALPPRHVLVAAIPVNAAVDLLHRPHYARRVPALDCCPLPRIVPVGGGKGGGGRARECHGGERTPFGVVPTAPACTTRRRRGRGRGGGGPEEELLLQEQEQELREEQRSALASAPRSGERRRREREKAAAMHLIYKLDVSARCDGYSPKSRFRLVPAACGIGYDGSPPCVYVFGPGGRWKRERERARELVSESVSERVPSCVDGIVFEEPRPHVCVRTCAPMHRGKRRKYAHPRARGKSASVGGHHGSREGQERRGKGAPVGEGQERISGRASRQPLL